MKRLMFVVVMSLLVAISLSAQNNRQRGDKDQMERDRQRIERLEKIKLIEVLNLSEEAVMKFFARRNEYFNNARKFGEEKKKISDQLEADMKAGKKFNNRYYKGLIDKMIQIDRERIKRREDFYQSLSDILTTEQIAKLMVFANKFNEEIMNEMMRGNRPQK